MVTSLTFLAVQDDSARADATFYRPDADLLFGEPGSIIRSEPMAFPPPGAAAYRILYQSTGLHGERVAVSGVLVVPTSGDNSERPIVAWAHPTSGVVPACAPSLSRSALREIQGLNELLADGYAVVATDYPGLGTVGPHPYLIGDSEGKAVLDSVRAARDFLSQQRDARFAVWGHSQGGQAALYTGILVHSYAPELRLVGIAAAAPATDLSTLMRDDYATSGGKGLTALSLWSWSKLYGIPTGDLVEPSAIAAMDRLATGCIETIFDLLERRSEERPLEKTFLSSSDISSVEPWKSILTDNSAGLTPRDIPVFIAQGMTDDIVRPRRDD
jgi:pimeloyl-ACP methyl ester carboxylesterase